MATEFRADTQSAREVYSYTADFTSLMDEEEIIQTATITHTPPSGDPLTIAGTTIGQKVIFDIGPLDILGDHVFLVLATMTDGHKAELKLTIPVLW